jgi:RimJ/RimL family protein N-acetyltransferase
MGQLKGSERKQMEAIETERLVLRRFVQGDAADLFEYLHQPVASCFLSLALADIRDAEREALERSTHDASIAVCLRTSDKLIGDLFAEPEGDTFSVGWNFHPDFGGKGYAHEAATALFIHLFKKRAARRLYAYVEDTNTSSQRLCERLGMRQEGVFMEFISFRNDASGAPIYENTMQYALLRHEWLSASRGPK